MPQIILMERTANLASYTFLQEMLINIQTRHFHSSFNHPELLFHRTIALKNSFFIWHLQKQSFADVLQNRYPLKFRKLHKKALVFESLFKNLAGWRPATS